MSGNVDVPKLERSLTWALANDRPASELVSMLRPLVQHTSPAAERGVLARLQLSENLLLAEYDERPRAIQAYWEAASLLHAVIPVLRAQAGNGPDSQALVVRALSAFGLACTFLEHYRLAKRAYLEALREDPANAVTAHNLGHLLSAKLGDPRAGLYWLQLAHAGLPENVEVCASLAHALVRTRQIERATAVMARALNDSAAAAGWVARWLDASNSAAD